MAGSCLPVTGLQARRTIFGSDLWVYMLLLWFSKVAETADVGCADEAFQKLTPYTSGGWLSQLP